jgi:hypothetical protein
MRRELLGMKTVLLRPGLIARTPPLSGTVHTRDSQFVPRTFQDRQTENGTSTVDHR